MLIVVLLRANPARDELIQDSVCERKVVVALGGDIAILHLF